MVMVLGEFGREPKINKQAGREHWGRASVGCSPAAGVRGGQVIGKSDKDRRLPVHHALLARRHRARRSTPLLGIDPHAEVTDRLGRPGSIESRTRDSTAIRRHCGLKENSNQQILKKPRFELSQPGRFEWLLEFSPYTPKTTLFDSKMLRDCSPFRGCRHVMCSWSR